MAFDWDAWVAAERKWIFPERHAAFREVLRKMARAAAEIQAPNPSID
ncbi:MAG: hypothetical protein Q8M76_07475 [Spirochaetaceae bacterium]|nr:hypothetical protein [Spirochaetaceae bacterium]